MWLETAFRLPRGGLLFFAIGAIDDYTGDLRCVPVREVGTVAAPAGLGGRVPPAPELALDGPQYIQSSPGVTPTVVGDTQLEAAYVHVFQRMITLGAATVAIPALSTGSFNGGRGVEAVLQIAIRSIVLFAPVGIGAVHMVMPSRRVLEAAIAQARRAHLV
jgi:hypothetical protein